VWGKILIVARAYESMAACAEFGPRYGADGKIAEDYATVSRLLDPETEGSAIVIAEVQSFCPRPAGELVIDPGQLRKLEARSGILAPGVF
jgi:hypothetical protein